MLTSKMIKEAALAAGADICGIGSMDRFDGVPAEWNPQNIYPDAKSAICLAFRIPRGVQRGIEQGTQFFQYPSMAYGGTNQMFGPAVLYEVGRMIEDAGYEAFVYRNTGARGLYSDMDGLIGQTYSPEEKAFSMKSSNGVTGSHRTMPHTRAVREDLIPPDMQIHFRLCAVACGIGEIGWSKMLLTPQFGPMQRVMFIFTDAELEPDPLYDGPKLCKMCMKCAKECPGGCISTDPKKSITVNVAGKECTWGELDVWRCNAYYTAAGKEYNPFVPAHVFDEINVDLHLNDPRIVEAYSPCWVGYAMAKCGGCIRACVSVLERKGGCLEGRFKEPLRTGKAWKLDR